MRKLLVLVGLLLAAPVSAQPPELMDALRAQRATKPTPMSKAQISDVLNRSVAQFPGWGMLRKDGGNVCPTPYPGITISCDWVVNIPAMYGWDVITDSENLGEIKVGGQGPLQAGQTYVLPWPSEAPPTPTPEPTPQPGGGFTPTQLQQLSQVFRGDLTWSVNAGGPEWERNEVRFTSQQEMERTNHLAIMGRFSELQADINNPGWFKRVISSPAFKYGSVILGGIIAQKYGHIFGDGSTAP